MGKTAFGLCCARRVGVLLVAILGICVCSVAMSVYYVHSVQLSPSLDIVQVARKEWKHQRARVLAADDSGSQTIFGGGSDGRVVRHSIVRGREESMPESDAGTVESLNNIDISQHIEDKKRKEQQNHLQANGKINILSNNQNKNVNTGQVSPPRQMKKEDKWPTHNKFQKIKHKGYHSSNPVYEKPVRTRPNYDGEKYIVYLCHSNISCAGWGDRQHGIFSVYLLSLVTNRTFKVDFSTPCPLAKLYHPRIANWKVEPSEFDGLSSTHLYAMNDREFREYMKEIDFDKYFPQDVVYLTTNYDYYYSLKVNPLYKDIFNKHVRNRPRPIIFADLWQSIFKMNKRVIRRYTPALTKARVTEKHKLVCAHIRFGRNPSIPNDGDIRNTFATIKPFWAFLKRHSDPNKYRLFVASDWQGFRTKVNKLYENITVNVEGKVIHIDKYSGVQGRDALCGSSNNNQSCVTESESLCNHLEMVIADQYVLSKCDILLLTYSTFGKSAAYLRRSNKDLYLMDKGHIKPLMLFKERNMKH